MKRMLAYLCALALLFALTGCTPETFEITITCDPVTPGDTIGDIDVTVLLNGQPHQILRVDWGVWGEDAIEHLTPEDTFQAGRSYQMYLYYQLAEGMTTENVTVNFSQEYAEHYYTQETALDDQGNKAMMSLIGFDFTNAASTLDVTLENTTVGSKLSDVTTDIRYNGQSITPIRVDFGVWGEDTIEYLTPEDTFQAGKAYQIYIYFPIAGGMSSETMTVNVTGENTEHYYTQETETDAEGTMGMMTLVGVDFSSLHQLDITCENVQVGNTPKDVTVTLLYNGAPLEPTRIYWSVMGEDAMEKISNKTQFLGGRYYQLYLYYPMDAQVTPEQLTVQLTAENSEHIYAEPAEIDGSSEMMSLIGFDFTAIADNHKHNWKTDPDKKPAEASCTQEGKEYLICTICGETDTKTIPMEQHEFSMDRILEGNCLTGMRYIEKCSQCGKEQERSRAPGRHTWGSTAEYWNNWTHILTCTICGVTKDEDHSLSGNYCSACDSHIIN